MSPSTKEVVRGFASLAAINVLFEVLALMLASGRIPVFQVAVFAIGLVQLLWALPWQIHAFATGRRSFGLGLVIAAAVTALLNGACFLVVVNLVR